MYTPASGIKLEPVRMAAVIDVGGATKSNNPTAKNAYVPPSKRGTSQVVGTTNKIIEFNDSDFPSLSTPASLSGRSAKLNFKKAVDDCIEREKQDSMNASNDSDIPWSEMTPEQQERAGIVAVSVTKRR